MPHPRTLFVRSTTTFGALTAALALGVALASPALAADVTQETRPLKGEAHSIHLSGPIDVRLSQGPGTGVHLEGNAEARGRVKVELINGEIQISFENDHKWFSWNSRPVLKASLSLPSLKGLRISGSGDVSIGDFDLKNGDLNVDIDGAGDIVAEKIQANALRVRIRGSGDIKAAGQIVVQEVSIAGSGDYDAGRLKSRQATISIEGSGDARLWATDTLNVDIAGSGDVRYEGDPKVTQRIRGSGEVTRRSTN